MTFLQSLILGIMVGIVIQFVLNKTKSDLDRELVINQIAKQLLDEAKILKERQQNIFFETKQVDPILNIKLEQSLRCVNSVMKMSKHYEETLDPLKEKEGKTGKK